MVTSDHAAARHAVNLEGIFTKLTVLSSALALLGTSSSAHASLISPSLVGTITAGYGGGLNGANDIANLFGGGNLSGATVILSFTYNTDLLDSAAASGIHGSLYRPEGSSGETYLDFASDGAVTVSATVGAYTIAMSNIDPTWSEGMVQRSGTVEANGLTLFALFAQNYGGTTGYYPKLEFCLYVDVGVPLGQLSNADTIAAFDRSVVTASLISQNSSGNENLTVSGLTPLLEPTTLGLVAIGLVGAALLSRRKSVSKQRRQGF